MIGRKSDRQQSDATLARQQSGLNAIPHLELLENVGHVVLDRLLLKVEFSADLLVAAALGDEAKYLLLAL